ncbi:carboxypeptidase-like regulatory domain-containing protein [Flagellimonas sp.]|uniref:carboxypeptidase-like regulatory domain-containing protein n=1 Tax=Flagellimonas sp. TaxID=2058762 RepID=UPI003F49B504
MKNRSLFIGLLFLLGSTLYSQTEDDFLLGTIIDHETEKPIPFATIKVVGKSLGVISNEDGGFRIPKRYQIVGKGLEISCMGYEKKEIPFSNLTTGTLNIVRLKAGVFELLGATVTAKPKRRLTPRRILRRAIQKITENYPQEAFSYVGYYRDYQQKDDEYLNLNEAILNVFDSGFSQNDNATTQALIYDYSQNLDFKRDNEANKPYNYSTRNKIITNAKLFSFGGNEFYILRIHDAIRNYSAKTFSYVDVLEKDIIKNHMLTREKDVLLGDESMFVIGLKGSNSSFVDKGYTQSRVNGDIRAEGKIYISQSSYAIHKMVYSVFDLTENDKKSKKNQGQAEKKLLYEIAVEYKENEGKMYPNYLSMHNTFQLKKTYFFVEEIILDSEKKRFVIRTNNSPIFLKEFGRPNVELRYQTRRIQVKEIKNTNDGILVYPNRKQLDEILKQYKLGPGEDKITDTDSFQFVYFNIVDQYGNVLNKIIYEDYEQFREFFTQRINTDSSMPLDSELFMKKNNPIFIDQPIVKPGNFNEYWMNTPLKK